MAPAALAGLHATHNDEVGRAWIAELPALAESCLDRWQLRLDGPPGHGMASLVLPVLCPDGVPAALKLQPVDDENVGEAVGLRAWDGNGAVRLLDEDPSTGALLLERLEADRPLSSVPNDMEALRILAELLGRLVALPAPAGLRRLSDIAARMLDQVPYALTILHRDIDRRLVAACAGVVRDLLPESGDRLLHWDLHYDNILGGQREPWLAIDPKPLAGDPGFELLPALVNRWDDVVATGDIARAVCRRFDLLVDVLALDRPRAVGWTLGRVLQNTLWEVEDGGTEVDGIQVAIAEALVGSRALPDGL